MTTQTISPCLWCDRQAAEAAAFYPSIVHDARIDGTLRASVDTPGANTGDTLLVDCTLAGQQYHARNSGAHDRFNAAMSLGVTCQDHAEVDRLWNALIADGGTPGQCGWLQNTCGGAWQVVPDVLPTRRNEKDRATFTRVMDARMQRVTLDIDALQQAYKQSA